ncbi:MAG: hemopexin repeat-containing protein, partial [Methanomassiliicoccales archaeon]
FDAALNGRGAFAGKAYFFKGDSYIRFDWKNDHADVGFPKKIVDGWRQLPSEFQKDLGATLEGFAAFAGKAYFFKGNDYLRYDWVLDKADE